MRGCVGTRAGRREGLWDLVSPVLVATCLERMLLGLRTPAPDNPLFSCRWRLGSIRTYNPEQIMLSAAVRRSSRDVKIMKEKLIFSGMNGAGCTKLFAPSYSCYLLEERWFCFFFYGCHLPQLGQGSWTDPAALNHLWDVVLAHPSQYVPGLSTDLLINPAFNFPSCAMQLSYAASHLLS